MKEERRRLHPSSSDLIALASLTPPSPILSPTLPTTLTSGDIPILLDLVDLTASSSFCEHDPRANRFNSESVISPSNSNSTVGTFGPIQTCRDSWIPEPWSSTPGNHDTFGCVSDPLTSPTLDSRTSPRSLKNHPKVVNYEDNPNAYGTSHIRHATVESLPEFFQSPPNRLVNIDNPTRSHRLQRSQPRLPPSLAWLDSCFIELSIDQEGFRAVQARFRFTGYSGRHSLDHHGDSPDKVAQFRPISRQVFNFHYATLESLPVLRRITVNGDEARDYITRQASLGLKVNGVYTVQGNEVPSLPATFCDGDPPVKLCWNFEYFVDDRKVDTTGKKTVGGEKSLTPLTFSCSPLLLHPFQGKRITMIHTVKKSVATKLVAEKMKPPFTQMPFPVPNPYSQRIPVHLSNKPSVWNTHGRAKSHVLPQTKEHDGGQQLSINLNYHESPPCKLLPDARSTRRRRASSAGEMDRPCVVVASPNAGSFPVPHPVRHIISRPRLAELLDQETENIPIATASPPPPMNVSGFQPLKPSPRHHHAWTLRP